MGCLICCQKEEKMSESITGYIDHIIFRNEDNGYTVMVLKGAEEEEELTCVGSFPVVTQGASVELEGNFTQHPVYGKQFQAVRLTEKMPEDALAMEESSGILVKIHCESWKTSRNGCQKSRGSVKRKPERLPCRSQRNQTCEKQ